MTTSFDREDIMSSTAGRPSDPVLAMPEGWVIDPSSAERLARRLARADPEVVAVAAEQCPLPPGSSYRVLSERRGLAPETATVQTAERTMRGAMLVRAGVAVEVGEGTVSLEHGRLLIDPGTAVHDPSEPTGDLENASPLGRPPFPHRPVVLLLGLEPDADIAGWARDAVNDLVRHGAEGRIAVPTPPDGFHLTRPCLPTEDSVAALAPDVVVALDERAVEHGSEWLGRDRSAVVVRLARDLTGTAELVSWRIGQARGRVRAQIRRDIEASELLELVRRLCAGPPPIPPIDRPGRGGTPKVVRWRSAPARTSPRAASPTLAILAGSDDDREHLEGFADHARPVTARSTIQQAADGFPPAAETADIVILRGLSDSERMHELVARRRAAGRSTVVDLTPHDLLSNDISEHRARGVLVPAAARLANAAGAVTTNRRDILEPLRAVGVRAHHLPTLLTKAHAARLRRLGRSREQSGPPVLGWRLDAATELCSTAHGVPSVLTDALLSLGPDVIIEVVGEGVADEWSVEPRVTVLSRAPEPETVVRWTAQVCTTPPSPRALDDQLRAVVEAQYLGVPNVVTADSPAFLEGLVVPELAVAASAGANGWRDAVAPLLDEVVWRDRSQEAIRLAEALYGPTSAASVVQRFLGWLRFRSAL